MLKLRQFIFANLYQLGKDILTNRIDKKLYWTMKFKKKNKKRQIK